MRKITKMSLDELARTMSVIQLSDLKNFVGGGTITYYSQVNALTGHLSAWTMSSDYVEAVFFQFSDGTYAMYIDNTSANTASSSTFSVTLKSDGNYYFENKSINSWGHTHLNTSGPSGTDLNNQMNGVPAYIFYSGAYYAYP